MSTKIEWTDGLLPVALDMAALTKWNYIKPRIIRDGQREYYVPTQ